MRLVYLLLLVAVCSVCAVFRREGFEDGPQEKTPAEMKLESCQQKKNDLVAEIAQIKEDHKNSMKRSNQIRDKYNSNGEMVKKIKDITEKMKKEVEDMKPKIPEMQQKIDKMKADIKEATDYLESKKGSNIRACL